MLSTNHCVILCPVVYPRWSCSLRHSVFSYTLSVFASKGPRNCDVHILVANYNISEAAGILLSESMSEPRGFVCLFLWL